MSGSAPITPHVMPLLEAYHAGTLSPEQTEWTARHLLTCAQCREQSEQVAMYQLIRNAPAPTAGPELRQRLYARIAEDSSTGTARAQGRARLRQRDAGGPAANVESRDGRAHGWLSGATALALVALLVSLFWALPHLRQQGRNGNHQIGVSATAACPASATSARIPANAILSDMALTSATEGWAVGALANSQGVGAQGLILRFAACHWTTVPLDLPGFSLTHISMDSPADGWAAGLASSGSGFVLLHGHDGVWSQVPAAQRPSGGGYISALSMRTPNDGWLVTMGPDEYSNGTVAVARSRLWHDAQGTWINIACPLHMIDAIAPVGPDDLWIAGSDFVGSSKQTTHSYAHYHNGQWTVTAQPAGLWTQSLQTVSPTDIWASGLTVNGTALIAHYDGATWNDAPDRLPAAIAQGNGRVIALGKDEGWASVFGGARGPEAPSHVASILRETGGRWQSLSWPYTDITEVNAWTPLADGEVWAIGTRLDYGTPTPFPGGGSGVTITTQTFLLHYAGGSWARFG